MIDRASALHAAVVAAADNIAASNQNRPNRDATFREAPSRFLDRRRQE